MNKVLAEIKKNGQDFEWYPTTREMVKVIHSWIDKRCSILDIGAGDGNALKILDELNGLDDSGDPITHKKYAIEKSAILRNNMPPDIFILGTDFHQQTLIDKQVDVIFCNPPYSEYSEWMIKIINEANCKDVFIVVPERWRENKEIQECIKRRNTSAVSLGKFTFMDSEYRKARAVVEILSFSIRGKYSRSSTDPFSIWFKENFNLDHGSTINYSSSARIHKKVDELVSGRTIIEVLEELYQNDFKHLLSNYKSISEMDGSILEELGVSRSSIMGSLESKISGLKNAYWKELFDNFDMITSRLIQKRRNDLLNQLTANTAIDFNSDNAFAVALWVIKNANQYFDQQLIEVYDEWTSEKNVKGYKSNSHWSEDGWRYLDKDNGYNARWKRMNFQRSHDRYKLDYRLVMELYNALEFNWDKTKCQGLSTYAKSYITDIFTIAGNLGYKISESVDQKEWEPGVGQDFYTIDDKQFCEIKVYKKGTIHIKFCKSFIQKFNIEAGRLKGWLKNPTHAAEETGIPLNVVNQFYMSNIQITKSDLKMLES